MDEQHVHENECTLAPATFLFFALSLSLSLSLSLPVYFLLMQINIHMRGSKKYPLALMVVLNACELFQVNVVTSCLAKLRVGDILCLDVTVAVSKMHRAAKEEKERRYTRHHSDHRETG